MIPTRSRLLVKGREQDRCARCAGRGAAWHHRRRRRVTDVHTHCPCNGVWLCTTCHTWTHSNPGRARESGLIVAAHEPWPGAVPLVAYHGTVRLTCEGTIERGAADAGTDRVG